MASDSTRESKESLLQEIERLEKEKEELECRNREQKLRELRGTVSSLRSGDLPVPLTPAHGTPTTSHGISSLSDGCRDSGIFDSNRRNVDSSLQEVQDSAHGLQECMFGSPSTHSPGVANRVSREKGQPSEYSSSDEDDVMSAKHKQAIQAYRAVLVENMLPDDIFNDLISNKILTTPDVSRIKEKNTREAINEELLTILCRRSNRAFDVFVTSLRKTLQDYLANKIDPQSLSKSRKKKRKRQTGEVNISVDIEKVEPSLSPHNSQHTSHSSTRQSQRLRSSTEHDFSSGSCSCQEVEEQILRMAKEAYRNIRRRDTTPAAFEQFRKELQQTNAVVKESMEIMHTLKILCRHGDIRGISEGSIILTLRCHSVSSAKELWNMYKSGHLQSLIENGFITQSLKKLCRVQKVVVRVGMLRWEYQHCLAELSKDENKASAASCCVKLRSRKRRTCENSNFTAGVGHHPLRPYPRKAFQEIISNHSPVCKVPAKCCSKPMRSKLTSATSTCPSFSKRVVVTCSKSKVLSHDLSNSVPNLCPSSETAPSTSSCMNITVPDCHCQSSPVSPSCVFIAAPQHAPSHKAVATASSASPSFDYVGLQNFSSEGITTVNSSSASCLKSSSSVSTGSTLIKSSSQGSLVFPCAKADISKTVSLFQREGKVHTRVYSLRWCSIGDIG